MPVLTVILKLEGLGPTNLSLNCLDSVDEEFGRRLQSDLESEYNLGLQLKFNWDFIMSSFIYLKRVLKSQKNTAQKPPKMAIKHPKTRVSKIGET